MKFRMNLAIAKRLRAARHSRYEYDNMNAFVIGRFQILMLFLQANIFSHLCYSSGQRPVVTPVNVYYAVRVHSGKLTGLVSVRLSVLRSVRLSVPSAYKLT